MSQYTIEAKNGSWVYECSINDNGAFQMVSSPTTSNIGTWTGLFRNSELIVAFMREMGMTSFEVKKT